MKLITLNLEGDRHLDVALPFLERESPDVLCLQEVFESDSRTIAETLGLTYGAFAPMTRRSSFIRDSELLENGVALLSRYPISQVRNETYYASTDSIEVFDRTSAESIDRTVKRVLVTAVVDGMSVGTTHFSWTPDGLPNVAQRKAMDSLMRTLSSYPSLILCGDFNIPRHVNELYIVLTKEFSDAVPEYIKGSIDLARHRTKDDPEVQARLAGYMVDYILQRGAPRVKDVRMECGVSDHCALVATIVKA